MWFSSRDGRAHGRPGRLHSAGGGGPPALGEPLRGRAWVLVLPLSIAVVVGAIAVIPSTADALTWVALILVPLGRRARVRVGDARGAAVARRGRRTPARGRHRGA